MGQSIWDITLLELIWLYVWGKVVNLGYLLVFLRNFGINHSLKKYIQRLFFCKKYGQTQLQIEISK